jgi:type IV pili sensor histidine kinase/response regulator
MSISRLAILSASIGLISGCAQTQVKAPMPSLSSDIPSRVSSILDEDVSNLSDIYALDGDVVYLLDGLEAVKPVEVSSNDEIPVDVVKVGRYQLVQTSPDYVKANLLEQHVSVNVIVAKPLANIGHALFDAVELSGFTLCNRPEVKNSLYKMPLPSIHYRMGPMTLINTMQVLVGPGWRVMVDQTNRSICFEPFNSDAKSSTSKSAPSASEKIHHSEQVVDTGKMKPAVRVVPVEPLKQGVSNRRNGFNDYFENQSNF